MKEETRRAIAYAASARVNQSARSSIYSFETAQHSFMGGSRQSGYDYSTGAHFSISGNTLHHYGTASHISFNVSGQNFTGYDCSSGHHFYGRVNGKTVQLYDYGEGRYFTYTI